MSTLHRVLPHSLIIFNMNKFQEIDFCYETKARKVIVNFKFDALSRKAIRKFVLVGGESVTALTDSLPRLCSACGIIIKQM